MTTSNPGLEDLGPDYEYVLVSYAGTDNRIGIITLNRPEKMNALSQELLYELNDALHMMEADSSVRVVILKGAGRTFSAGYDLAPAQRTGADGVVRSHRGAAPTGVDVHGPAGGFRQRKERPPPIHVVAQAVTPPALEHQHLGPRRVRLGVFFERGAEAGFALNAKPLVTPPQPRERGVRIVRGSLVTVGRRLDRFAVRRRRRGGFRWRRR